ncbi:MAG: putative quinol monooxygenase [Nocardioides sp.]
MSELHAVATIPAKPEAVDAIRAALQTLVAATRAEEGCLSYDLYESGAAPGVFITMERWVDQAAMDAHLQMPHVAEAFAAADGALAGEVAIHPLMPVEVG